jgi:hypothetical protein
MSPQPIDAQSMLARMAVADRAQHVAEREPVVQQERLAVQAPAQSAHRETQVQKPEQTEQERVRDKQRRKEPFSGKKRRKKQRGKERSSDEKPAQSDPATYSPRAEKDTAGGHEGTVLDLKA